MWNAAHADRAKVALNDLVESYKDRHPAFAEWLESSATEGFTVFTLPDRNRVSMRTSNPMERAIQQKLKRRTRIVRDFPNERLCCGSAQPS